MRKRVFLMAGLTLLAVSAAGYCQTVLRRRKASGPAPEEDDRHTGETPPAYSDTVSKIADGIRKHASEFDGLYEGLYQAAKTQRVFSTDAYEEWCGRVGQLGDGPFRHAFCELFRPEDCMDEAAGRLKYGLLLRCIAAAGITRDSRDWGQSCLADDGLRAAYIGEEGKPPRIGGCYTVVKPAWFSGQKVIEYGIAFSAGKDPGNTGKEET